MSSISFVTQSGVRKPPLILHEYFLPVHYQLVGSSMLRRKWGLWHSLGLSLHISPQQEAPGDRRLSVRMVKGSSNPVPLPPSQGTPSCDPVQFSLPEVSQHKPWNAYAFKWVRCKMQTRIRNFVSKSNKLSSTEKNPMSCPFKYLL